MVILCWLIERWEYPAAPAPSRLRTVCSSANRRTWRCVALIRHAFYVWIVRGRVARNYFNIKNAVCFTPQHYDSQVHTRVDIRTKHMQCTASHRLLQTRCSGLQVLWVTNILKPLKRWKEKRKGKTTSKRLAHLVFIPLYSTQFSNSKNLQSWVASHPSRTDAGVLDLTCDKSFFN